jgi:hypothetical protein
LLRKEEQARRKIWRHSLQLSLKGALLLGWRFRWRSARPRNSRDSFSTSTTHSKFVLPGGLLAFTLLFLIKWFRTSECGNYRKPSKRDLAKSWQWWSVKCSAITLITLVLSSFDTAAARPSPLGKMRGCSGSLCFAAMCERTAFPRWLLNRVSGQRQILHVVWIPFVKVNVALDVKNSYLFQSYFLADGNSTLVTSFLTS